VTVGLAALMTFGCGNVLDSSNGTNQTTQQQPLGGQTAGTPFKIWAVDTNGALFSFFSDNPGAVTAKTPITGVVGNEKIAAIDVRPRTGVLYGIDRLGKLYWIDKNTGVATFIGNGQNPAQINADIDFNPRFDVIRQEADAQNVRINPGTAAVTADTNLTLQPANVPANAVALAYTNPDEAPSSTQLFVITGASNRVYLQANPNDGKLTEVGQLPLDIGSNVGFDIAPGNVGFVSVQNLNNPAAGSTLLRFDPASGAATIESIIGGGVAVKSIAVDLPGPSLVRFVGIDANKNLVRFNSNDPTTLLSSTVITGVAETIVGCDFSPGGDAATGLKVLAVPTGGGQGKIYSVNLNTAAGTLISTTTVALPDPASKLFGVDILPSGNLVATAATGTFTSRRVLSGQSTQVFSIVTGTGATTVLNSYPGYIPAFGFDRNFVGGGVPFGYGVNLRNSGANNDVPALEFVSADSNGIQSALGFMNQVTTEICELDLEPNGNMWFVGPRVDLRTATDANQPLPVEGFSTLFRIGLPSFGASTVARVGGAPIKSFAIIPALNADLTTAP